MRCGISKTAYYHGMLVQNKLRHCLKEGYGAQVRWTMALHAYFWNHDLPERCSDIRDLAEILRPASVEEE